MTFYCPRCGKIDFASYCLMFSTKQGDRAKPVAHVKDHMQQRHTNNKAQNMT